VRREGYVFRGTGEKNPFPYLRPARGGAKRVLTLDLREVRPEESQLKLH